MRPWTSLENDLLASPGLIVGIFTTLVYPELESFFLAVGGAILPGLTFVHLEARRKHAGDKT